MSYKSSDFPVNGYPLYEPTRWQGYIMNLVNNGTTKFWPSILLIAIELGFIIFPLAGVLTIILSLVIGMPVGVVIGIVLMALGWFAWEQNCTAVRLGAMIYRARSIHDELVYTVDELDRLGVDHKHFNHLERAGNDLRRLGKLLYPKLEEVSLIEMARLWRYYDVADDRKTTTE